MHFVDDAPPPSYDQAVVDSAALYSGGHSNPIGAIPLGATVSPSPLELSEKMVAQRELIREQEAEIGKLKRDLGRMREQMLHQEKHGNGNGNAGTEPGDKLAQRLAHVVDEEAEEQRRKSRSRKGDIIRGSLCCVALLAVLLLGLYVVLNRPSASASPARPSMEQFRVVGKAIGDNLCWAQALIQPRGRTQGCHIFRRSLTDQRLFCEFGLSAADNNKQLRQPIQSSSWSRRKGLIVLQQDSGTITTQAGITTTQQKESGGSIPPHPPHLLVHILNEAESREARHLCTEQILPLLRPTHLILGRRRALLAIAERGENAAEMDTMMQMHGRWARRWNDH